MQIQNPFKVLRTEAQLSQYELAKRADISKHAVLRCEQGMYPDPLPRLVNFFVENFGASRVSLLNEYEVFQVQTRVDSGKLLGPLDYFYARGWTPSVGHPFVWQRVVKNLNPTEIAKRLCISQSTVVFFEKHPLTQQTVPQQLLNALHEAGYSLVELAALSEAYNDYRQWLISQRSLRLVAETVEVTSDAV